MEVSLRYPPVVGRLHTRYAPVRRSPAEYCYSLLPLDLHVLSLPLAFILSQDQTLHCKNCSCYLFDSSSYPPPYPYRAGDTRYLFLLIRFKSLSLFRRKRMQRYNLFPFHQNNFSLFHLSPTLPPYASTLCKRKNFHPSAIRRPANPPHTPQIQPVFGQIPTLSTRFSAKITASVCKSNKRPKNRPSPPQNRKYPLPLYPLSTPSLPLLYPPYPFQLSIINFHPPKKNNFQLSIVNYQLSPFGLTT